MSTNEQSVAQGEMQLYDSQVPGLAAGQYTIRLRQTLAVSGASIPDKTQEFVVRAPQFALPSVELHTCFPPANGTGQFADTLPFVVLNEWDLPWERSLAGQVRTTPWLALLVLTEDELCGDPTPAGNFLTTTTVGELLTPMNADVLKETLVPNITPATVDTSLNCQFIEIPGATFLAVVPTIAELSYLAHCRQINTSHTALFEQKEKGKFAVVMSNRFPSPPAEAGTAGRRNIVHLVSLEGYEQYLTASPLPLPHMAAPYDTSQFKRVRLVSLANWTFTCLGAAGQTFGGLAQGLFRNSAGQPETTDNLRLKLSVAAPVHADGSATAIAQQRLSQGYAALTYHTLSGEDTFAWYRGPLAAYPVGYLPKHSPFLTASGAMIYDRTNGLFDLSLAAAWQIGRSLALASQSFSQALLRLRRRAQALVSYGLASGAISPGQEGVEMHMAQHRQGNRGQDREQAGQWFDPAMLARIGELSKSGVTREQALNARAHLRSARSARKPANQISLTRTMLASEGVQQALAQELTDELQPIAAWLARLRLLHGVPFDHLVSDPRMLPLETIRFFYVDQNWLDALLDGAISIGGQSGLDTIYLQTLYAAIRQATFAALTDYESSIAKGYDLHPGTVDAPETQSGLLIRSALISGWPGLIVQAKQSGTLLKTLRMTRLAPDVLLCVFQGVPDTVTLGLPQESLSFGVTDEGLIDLRYVSDGSSHFTGQPQSPVVTLNVKANYLRAGGNRVLNVQSLAAALQSALHLGTALTPSQFALQMIKSAEYLQMNAPI